MKNFFNKLPFKYSLALLILVAPASTNYQLNQFGFNSGSEVNNSSSSYSGNSAVGDVTGDNTSSTNYTANPGLINTFQANVPGAPTLTNPASYYDKLLIAIDTASNPSDTKFAVAISSNNFVTTQYVKSDNTIGPILASADLRTYSGWGSGSGTTIIGLTPSTSYKVKVSAMQGSLTQSAYGPSSTASTSPPQLTFSLSPSSVNFGNLNAGSVASAPSNITANLDTNADSGAVIAISDQNTGFHSTDTTTTITSATADLASVTTGYGAQVASTTQTSGGPLNSSSPYNVSGTNVGGLSTTSQAIFLTSAPIVGGSGQILLKAKASSLTPAASDYTDTLTVIAAGNF
jgi:hypothetical protein